MEDFHDIRIIGNSAVYTGFNIDGLDKASILESIIIRPVAYLRFSACSLEDGS